MKVVLDTNVLVSAAIGRRGPPASVYQAWRDREFQLVVSLDTLSELRRVLSYPRVMEITHLLADGQQRYLGSLRRDALFVSPTREITVSRDPDDNRILEAAIAGAADYIVTGDQDLLVLREFEGIAIVTPTRFLAILRDIA